MPLPITMCQALADAGFRQDTWFGYHKSTKEFFTSYTFEKNTKGYESTLLYACPTADEIWYELDSALQFTFMPRVKWIEIAQKRGIETALALFWIWCKENPKEVQIIRGDFEPEEDL